MSKVAIIITGKGLCQVKYIWKSAPAFESTGEETYSLSSNFMLGVRNSESEYLIRFDHSDIEHDYSDYIQAFTEFLDESNFCSVHPTYRISGEVLSEHLDIETPQGSGIMYRRACFLSTGGYDTSYDLQADLDFYLGFTHSHSMTHLNEVYHWKYGDNRSLLKKDAILKVRAEILAKYNRQNDLSVPHFGMYAYENKLRKK